MLIRRMMLSRRTMICSHGSDGSYVHVMLVRVTKPLVSAGDFKLVVLVLACCVMLKLCAFGDSQQLASLSVQFMPTLHTDLFVVWVC